MITEATAGRGLRTDVLGVATGAFALWLALPETVWRHKTAAQ